MAESTLIKSINAYEPIHLPSGNYFYKTKNGKHIYLNRYSDEFYIMYPIGSTGTWTVEYYRGVCSC